MIMITIARISVLFPTAILWKSDWGSDLVLFPKLSKIHESCMPKTVCRVKWKKIMSAGTIAMRHVSSILGLLFEPYWIDLGVFRKISISLGSVERILIIKCQA